MTLPKNISDCSLTQFKQINGQKGVTLSFNRRGFMRENLIKALCYKLNKKSALLLCTCVIIVIIYANSEQFFQQKLISLILSRRGKDINKLWNYKTANINNNSSTHPIVTNEPLKKITYSINSTFKTFNLSTNLKKSNYNIFVIFTKENYHLHTKFDLFMYSLLKHTTIYLHLHIVTDVNSENSVLEIIQKQSKLFHSTLQITLYDINQCSERIQDITKTLSPYFNSSPNSYYSDSLFFLSLGLHKIADLDLKHAILLDCDIVFRSDVRMLFREFDHFQPQQLFGLAPELTPVYRHILYRYRVKYPKTDFGNPYYPMDTRKAVARQYAGPPLRSRIQHGYPGLNSGVVLIYLNRIRFSAVYEKKLEKSEIQLLVTKYNFKGHLGDQDLFTLFGYEYPNLIYRLDCVWNRQLCTWWKDHGYSDIFDAYFRCDGTIRMYHGNCNTRIPE